MPWSSEWPCPSLWSLLLSPPFCGDTRGIIKTFQSLRNLSFHFNIIDILTTSKFIYIAWWNFRKQRTKVQTRGIYSEGHRNTALNMEDTEDMATFRKPSIDTSLEHEKENGHCALWETAKGQAVKKIDTPNLHSVAADLEVIVTSPLLRRHCQET